MAQPSSASGDDTRRTIEEVVVTATKRSVYVRDLPSSIDAFTGDGLEQKGAFDLEELVKYSPGVSITKSPGSNGSNITVRGITNSGGAFTRAVGTLYEDISLINPSVAGVQPTPDPFDMVSVEVLKGPQGSLFGGSALSGAVRYVPRKPDFEAFGARLAYTWGSTERSEESVEMVTAMLNLPLGERLAFRYADVTRHNAGYVDDINAGRADINSIDVVQQRSILAWKVTERINLEFNYLDLQGAAPDSGYVDNPDDYTHSNRFYQDTNQNNTEIASVKLDWQFEHFEITAIASQLDKRGFGIVDDTYILGVQDTPLGAFQINNYETDQPSYELRLVSSESSQSDWWIFDGWDYLVGAFAMESDQSVIVDIFVEVDLLSLLLPLLPIDIPGLDLGNIAPGTSLLVPAFALAEEEAVFFDLTKQIGNHWEINLGGRYFQQTTEGGVVTALGVPSLGNIELTRDEGVLEEEGFNPKLALTWRAHDDLMVFASASRGFRFGGVNAVIAGSDTPVFFKSDQIWNYELGARTTWLDGGLQADATLFYIDWTDQQVNQRYEGLFAYVDNVGAAVVRGAEFGVMGLLPWGLSLTLNGAYVDSQTAAFFESDLGPVESGTRSARAPRWTGSAILGHSGQWQEWEMNTSFGCAYTGEQKNNLQNTFEIPSYSSLSFSFQTRNESLPLSPSLSLSITNLTNKTYLLEAINELGGETFLGLLSQPRTMLLTLGLEY